MPEPEVRFICIGCGESIPVGSDLCPGCRHQFRETIPAPAPPPREPLANFYEPPRTRVARPTSLSIASWMLLIAAISVCLGAFVASPVLGVTVTVGLLPASIRTAYLAARSRAEGRPMGLGDQLGSFVMTLGASYLVLFSSSIAFGCTCFPIAMAVGQLQAALIVGGLSGLVAALVVGIWLTRALLRVGQAARIAEQDRDSIRWL